MYDCVQEQTGICINRYVKKPVFFSSKKPFARRRLSLLGHGVFFHTVLIENNALFGLLKSINLTRR